jgi:ribosomal protein S18 acetylase RimI-like enzyme
MVRIREALSVEDVEEVRKLFREYQAAIGVDLCFQGFAEEMASLPGNYARPLGRLLLAAEGETVLGVVALRPLHGGDCEMKRLYVRPAGRGKGVGRLLAQTVLHEARVLRYGRIVLDTLPMMGEAQALYRSLGFVEIAPYYDNPIPGAKYMALKLAVD